jgi:type II secretory pathway pseudopilin PulG
MKIPPPISRSRSLGFSLKELAVALAAVAVILLLAAMAVRSVREKALRTQCRNNLMVIGVALKNYSLANDGSLPDCSPDNPQFSGGAWPWDINTNLVDELNRQGASRNNLYCPANPAMNSLEHWEFWRFTQTSLRIISYGMLFNGQGQEPPELWRKNLMGDGLMPPSQTELGFDATVSMNGDFIHIRGIWTDRSNHVRGSRPQGGNILFEDQHVDWRNFKQMHPRFSTHPSGLWYF